MYLKKHFNVVETPQSSPIPGSNQVQNSAGGYAFAVDDWQRLHRFLILGSQGGTYYVGEQKLTLDNADAVLRCVKADGPRVVNAVVEISQSGRAPKNDPALFVLAMCSAFGDAETKTLAREALPLVARIGTHVLHYVGYVTQMRGWGRWLRTTIAEWYTKRTAKDLAFQATKYAQRNGWSHRDLLRLSHPKARDEAQAQVFNYITKGTTADVKDPATEYLHVVDSLDTEASIVKAIKDYVIPMEVIPTDKRTTTVWRAILPSLGLTALIRNLGVLSAKGVIAKGQWETNKLIVDRIVNQEALTKARVHPIAVLSALNTYAQGHGARSQTTWEVVPEIVQALNDAFYLAFKNVEPTNKRIVLALDVSGSMGMGEIAGIPGLTPRVASAAMAMVTERVEPNIALVAFSHKMQPINISSYQRLDDVVNAVSRIPMGRTDCALPMLWALENNVKADAFVVYTDNETWHGRVHPVQALQMYRQKMQIPARLIVVGMTATEFSIADPDDAGMLDVVGFDSASPEVMSQFIRD